MSAFMFVYLAGMFAVLCLCAMSGFWILQPIANAVKGRRRPTRFSMVDFFWLSIMVTGSLAPLGNLASTDLVGVPVDLQRSYVSVIVGIIALMELLVIAIVWWRGVATLSGLGIDDPRRRGIFLIVVLPASITVSLMGVPAIVMSLISAFQGDGWEVLFWFLTFGGIALSVCVARRLCFWVLAGAELFDELFDESFDGPFDGPFDSQDDTLAVGARAD